MSAKSRSSVNQQAGFTATGVEKLRVRGTLEMLIDDGLHLMTRHT
jgi:hypothetical protein